MGNIYNVLMNYIEICTKTLDVNHFNQIISKHVELNHKINEEALIKADGREAVTALFQQSLFSNPSDILHKKTTISPIGHNQFRVTLIVNENKKDGDAIHHYVFEETTTFEFKKNRKQGEDNYKISRMDTVVKRTPFA